jgi:hypothetical protein
MVLQAFRTKKWCFLLSGRPDGPPGTGQWTLGYIFGCAAMVGKKVELNVPLPS